MANGTSRQLARVAAVAVAGLLGVAGSASASTPAALPTHPARFTAVSCLRAKWCMAVGSFTTTESSKNITRSLAEVWHGGSWRTLLTPPGAGLRTVTCSSDSYCVATGVYAGGRQVSVSWDGVLWSGLPNPAHQAAPPDCASPAVCLTINGAGSDGSGPVVEAWSGQQWQSYPAQTSVCLIAGTRCGLADVSCGSTVNCVAVGSAQYNQAGDVRPEAAAWNGAAWTISRPPASGSRSVDTADSCAGTFCLAIGVSASARGDRLRLAAYNATSGRWTSQPAGQVVASSCGRGCFPPGSLSCGSAANCLEFSGNGNLAWNGRALRPAPSVSAGRGSGLGAVSCGTYYCLAGGYRTINGLTRPLAELWNGATWKILPTP
jgi:hypothetical protein